MGLAAAAAVDTSLGAVGYSYPVACRVGIEVAAERWEGWMNLVHNCYTTLMEQEGVSRSYEWEPATVGYPHSCMTAAEGHRGMRSIPGYIPVWILTWLCTVELGGGSGSMPAHEPVWIPTWFVYVGD